MEGSENAHRPVKVRRLTPKGTKKGNSGKARAPNRMATPAARASGTERAGGCTGKKAASILEKIQTTPPSIFGGKTRVTCDPAVGHEWLVYEEIGGRREQELRKGSGSRGEECFTKH